MKQVVIFVLAMLVMLILPVMAIACTSCATAPLMPVTADAIDAYLVPVAPGAAELIAARAAQCQGTDKPSYIDMTIATGGAGALMDDKAQATPGKHYRYKDTGKTITPRARDRPALSGGNVTLLNTCTG